MSEIDTEVRSVLPSPKQETAETFPKSAREWMEDALGIFQVTHIHSILREAIKAMDAPADPAPEPQPVEAAPLDDVQPAAPALTREDGEESKDAQWFKKKPVTIQAKRWCGDRFEEMQAFTNNGVYWKEISSQHYLCVKTLEGEHVASVGDWIIRGVAGEFYPCKPDIFAATYSPASSPSPIPASQKGDETELSDTDALGHVMRLLDGLEKDGGLECSDLDRSCGRCDCCELTRLVKVCRYTLTKQAHGNGEKL